MSVNNYYRRYEVFRLLFHAHQDPLILTNLSLVQEDRETELNRLRGIGKNGSMDFPIGSCEEKSGLENYIDLSEVKNLSWFEIGLSWRSMMMIGNSNSINNNDDVLSEPHVKFELELDVNSETI